MKKILLTSLVFVLAGCSSTWSTSNVKNANGSSTIEVAKKAPRELIITESDIPDRKYKALGDIEVTVNKTTIFHKDPTREMVNEKLKEKAADMGADAVILTRYGTVGIAAMSWGALDGKGRAIVFLD